MGVSTSNWNGRSKRASEKEKDRIRGYSKCKKIKYNSQVSNNFAFVFLYIAVNLLAVMEDICDKLKILNYETRFCTKKACLFVCIFTLFIPWLWVDVFALQICIDLTNCDQKLPVLTRTFFAIAGKPSEQFLYFSSLIAWYHLMFIFHLIDVWIYLTFSLSITCQGYYKKWISNLLNGTSLRFYFSFYKLSQNTKKILNAFLEYLGLYYHLEQHCYWAEKTWIFCGMFLYICWFFIWSCYIFFIFFVHVIGFSCRQVQAWKRWCCLVDLFLSFFCLFVCLFVRICFNWWISSCGEEK